MIILCLWPVTGLISYFSVTLAFNVNIVKVNKCNKLEERESLKSTPLINFFEGRGYGYIFLGSNFMFNSYTSCVEIVV
jgi:hypothetical protein